MSRTGLALVVTLTFTTLFGMLLAGRTDVSGRVRIHADRRRGKPGNSLPGMIVALPEEIVEAASRVDVAQVASMIHAGDEAVVPLLMMWFQTWLESPRNNSPPEGRALLAIYGLGEFGQRRYLEVFLKLSRDPKIHPILRQKALRAATLMTSREEITLLEQILKGTGGEQGISKILKPSALLRIRCTAAARLVELGNDSGRKFLLHQSDNVVQQRKSGTPGPWVHFNELLESVSDRELVKAFETRRDAETDQRWRRYYGDVVERMRICAAPVQQLKIWATKTVLENAERRGTAILALGYRATPDLIPFLESLEPWSGVRAIA